MKRLLVAGLLLLASCSNGGYSEEFRSNYIEACVATSGGMYATCACTLDHLEDSGISQEDADQGKGMVAALQACI